MTKQLKNFEYWSNTLLAGCDGNAEDLSNARIWTCGIEYGISSKEQFKYYDELETEISSHYIAEREKPFNWQEHIKYRYGWSLAKLLTNVVSDNSISDIGHECKNLCDNNLMPTIFKANLYPIAFNSTHYSNWDGKNLDKITGFENKYMYETWCFFNRLPVFARLIKEHKPRLVIGTGVNYLHSFIAFAQGFESSYFELEKGVIHTASDTNGKIREYYSLEIDHGKNQKTTLFVTPFLSGSYGLNSDHLLKEMGLRIKNKINQID